MIFVDLVGFTARAERLDPEEVRAVLAPYHARVRGEIESFGGVVEKFIGDAVMGLFGAPLAHGDDAERAVRAALVVRDSVGELASGDLQIRIAVNTGEAVESLGARAALGESLVAGDVVNTASRLQASAPVNGIVVGEETYLETRDAIEYTSADDVVAKGKGHALKAWVAVRERTAAGERAVTTSSIVGRTSEIAILLALCCLVSGRAPPRHRSKRSRMSRSIASSIFGASRSVRGASLAGGCKTNCKASLTESRLSSYLSSVKVV